MLIATDGAAVFVISQTDECKRSTIPLPQVFPSFAVGHER
jgi:hypothetical protein